MERLVRTKIKGTMTVSSEHLSVPNFDDLPPLPVCYKQPSDVLDEIRRAVLKMNSSSIQHRDYSIMPLNLLHASVNDVTNHRTVLPGSESPCPWEFSLSVDQKQPIVCCLARMTIKVTVKVFLLRALTCPFEPTIVSQ
mmetsp:Transcript_10132/g.16703  ORF Transcript_10132/g.16703 Transcript_10132/m.16703 type:complete len:138 (-) Transcript_10132:295-708(-)